MAKRGTVTTVFMLLQVRCTFVHLHPVPGIHFLVGDDFACFLEEGSQPACRSEAGSGKHEHGQQHVKKGLEGAHLLCQKYVSVLLTS